MVAESVHAWLGVSTPVPPSGEGAPTPVYDAGLEGACGERGAAFDEYAVDAAFSKGGHKLPQIDASVVLGNAHDFAACLLEL